MAATSAARSLLLCLLVAFLHRATATSSASRNKTASRDDGRGKTLSFTLYQHETINKTGYIVVASVAGAGVSQTTTPFGTVYVFRDELTVRADRASPVAGVAEGSSITTSLDGLQSLSLAKITVRHRGRRGSVSVLGGTYNTEPSDYPVVGGTGDFAYALGYVRSSPVDLRGRTVTYKMELHLYWPPILSASTTSAGKFEIFTVYQHDRLNETGHVVVTGDEGAPSSDTTRPFGSIYVFRDELTLEDDRDSSMVGVMEGTSTTTSFDGLHNLLAAKISLHHRGYKGSASVLGGFHNTKPSMYPVVGGTGDFLYAEGYVRSSPVDSDGPRVVHKLEIRLYWPPYTKFAQVH